MTYINAYHDREHDEIHIVERLKGERVFSKYKTEHSFYYPDPKGQYLSIHEKPLSKFTTNNYKKYRTELKNFRESDLFESDIKPIFKLLEKQYLGADIAQLHTAGIDIEVDYSKERGYAPPSDPHQPITAISVSYDWLDKIVTLVLAPKTLTQEQAQVICDRFTDCILCENESQLIELFYELIEDVDVLYTWNGDFFDIPYIINRTIRILGKDYTRKMCFWDQLPKEKEFEKFGKTEKTYDIFGRVHLDYLELYRKFTYHEMHSYKLDTIGEYEKVGVKIAYEGTLDDLYNNDFEKFILYNRQDTLLLSHLDKKLQFIALVNTLAHDNCILMQNTLGSVALTDQAIVLEAHKRGFIVPSRQHDKNSEIAIAGGFVGNPKTGKLWDWIGSTDINSLYPSVIRSLNMSPETLIAQVKQTMTEPYIKAKLDAGVGAGDAWGTFFSCFEYDEIMKQSDMLLRVWFEREQQTFDMTAKEIYQWVFNSDMTLTANGTIFSTKDEGIIPGLLTKWYADRKVMQANKKDFSAKYDAALIDPNTDPQELKDLAANRDFWHQRQEATKIKLNALYGAISNVASRFADQRIGQSTTLSGRTIFKHMNAKINEILSGEYDYDGKCIVYGDTDSCYFSAEPVLAELKKNGFKIDRDAFAQLCDSIADIVNESFPGFVKQTFNTPDKSLSIIKCGREICGVRGLFPSKKRYAILIYDKEGKRNFKSGDEVKDTELKIMGLDTQRADTPKTIQVFLKQVLTMVLNGGAQDDVIDFIRQFRSSFRELPAWDLGMPKRVNNLTTYKHRIEKNGKTAVKGFTVPGHVQASLNWNFLRTMNNDRTTIEIMDGQKVVVCVLKDNPSRLKSVAYPIDEAFLPTWFKNLPFDTEAMETKLIDNKLDNIIGSLKWNLNLTKTSKSFKNLFTLE